jgi:hypothetical protein
MSENTEINMSWLSKSIKTAIIGIGLTTAIAPAAMAYNCSPGFLADVACSLGVINQGTANTLDGIHAAIGNPGQQLWNQFNRPIGAPANVAAPAPVPHPAVLPLPVSYGTVCYSSQFNLAGSGAPAPVGSACTLTGQFGQVLGQIIQ